MTKPPIDSSLSKSKGLAFLEYILLALCLCVIALRTTLTEGMTTSSTFLPTNLWDSVYSLSVSACLLIAFACWVVWSLCSKKILYRPTGMEIGLCVFCIAAVVAGFAASDKRLAITSFTTLLAPVIMAILLVQILDSQTKIKLLLCVIAALAVVSAYQSAEQFFRSNQMTIDQYEEAPQTILEPLGIEPGTFSQFLFEHRLYTRGIRGFFTTRNSAGSFLLMASFAAIALFIDRFNAFKSFSSSSQPNSKLNARKLKLSLLACGIVIGIILSALALTRSKGAILGLLFATALLFMFLWLGRRLKALSKIILIACLLFFISGGCIIVWYGMTHDRLPGGNSMLVRWQYWNASAKMYADYPLTGVGPGNFAQLYPHYKPAPALETVADPHNFPLSILTQYGPLGLIGFLAMLLIPLWRTTSSSKVEKSSFPQTNPLPFRTLAISYLIIISTVLLLIRPMIIRSPLGDTPMVMVYLALTLYIVPVAAFIIGFWLLTTELKTQAGGHELQVTYIPAVLFCAAIGVLIHNLIDFAIFELPVFTTFLAMIACLIATGCRQNNRPLFTLKPAPLAKILIGIIALAVIWAYFNYAFIPVIKSTARIQKAHSAISDGQFQSAHNLLSAAAEDDPLDQTASNLNGRLYLQHYHNTGGKQSALLKKAEQCFLEAIARDPANFKNYEKLSTVYDLLGRLQEAYEQGLGAAERYPGSAQIQFQLAQIAEKLKKPDVAIEHYKNAIEIEDSFRKQFKAMYPDREIVSRLDEDKYYSSKNRVELLSQKLIP